MYDLSPGTYNSEKEISLKPEFKWFLSDDFRTLKEKYPPSTKQNNKKNNENNETLRGENSFNQNITTLSKDSSIISKEALDEWYQKEREKIRPLDSSYFARIGLKCYYCDDFETDNSKHGKRNYESHIKGKHGDDADHPCYPSKADLERLELKPQGKRWEI